jgi:hypothetical protein
MQEVSGSIPLGSTISFISLQFALFTPPMGRAKTLAAIAA